MTRGRAIGLIASAALGVATVAASGTLAAASGTGAPKLVQLSYDEGYGDSNPASPTKTLEAYIRRGADRVRFSTEYNGESAATPAHYISHITDTDLRGPQSHPWRQIIGHQGHRVVLLVHDALVSTGVATVTVHVVANGRATSTDVEIVDADCGHDPPIYPISCAVEP
jgi:hypothetical protein